MSASLIEIPVIYIPRKEGLIYFNHPIWKARVTSRVTQCKIISVQGRRGNKGLTCNLIRIEMIDVQSACTYVSRQNVSVHQRALTCRVHIDVQRLACIGVHWRAVGVLLACSDNNARGYAPLIVFAWLGERSGYRLGSQVLMLRSSTDYHGIL